MKPRFFFLTVVLVATILAGCAPEAVSTQAPPPALVDPPISAPTTDSSQPAGVATVPPVTVFTSRGDRLEATNPATVSLATGGLHLVEFFRFT